MTVQSLELKEFLDDYSKELLENNAAVFVGAGLSKSAGFVDWQGLLDPIAKALGLDVRREHDLVTLAQFHVNANGASRNKLSRLLIEKFSDIRRPTSNHAMLARLPIQTYWTTNYDKLIERSLEDAGKRVDVKYTKEQLALTKKRRDAVLYKMHGDIDQPEKAILCKDDYENYSKTHGPFTTALAGDLVDKTFLFLGFSFTDPNLDFVLSRVRFEFNNHQRQHYCITRRIPAGRGAAKFEQDYLRRRQQLFAQDLMRFNIKTVFVEDYEDVTAILTKLYNRNRRKTIFVSGSAAKYAPWSRDIVERFVTNLSRELISKDFRVSSGFGLGIGSAVVSGAVEQIYSSVTRTIEDQLLVRPFPVAIKDPAKRAETYQRFRYELISRSGIAIFIFGNKLQDGDVVPADGMMEEFEIAKKEGLFLIPLGCTGSVAATLWERVSKDIAEFFPQRTAYVRKQLRALARPTDDLNKLLPVLVELILTLSTE